MEIVVAAFDADEGRDPADAIGDVLEHAIPRRTAATHVEPPQRLELVDLLAHASSPFSAEPRHVRG
jgi:hypothetical protein